MHIKLAVQTAVGWAYMHYCACTHNACPQAAFAGRLCPKFLSSAFLLIGHKEALTSLAIALPELPHSLNSSLTHSSGSIVGLRLLPKALHKGLHSAFFKLL